MKNQPLPLSEFYKDTATKDNVHTYLTEFLKEEAVKQLFEEESEFEAQAVAQAKKYIDLAFENLDNLFESKPKKKEKTNEAR